MGGIAGAPKFNEQEVWTSGKLKEMKSEGFQEIVPTIPETIELQMYNL